MATRDRPLTHIVPDVSMHFIYLHYWHLNCFNSRMNRTQTISIEVNIMKAFVSYIMGAVSFICAFCCFALAFSPK